MCIYIDASTVGQRKKAKCDIFLAPMLASLTDCERCSFVKIRWANDIFELFLSDPEKQQRQQKKEKGRGKRERGKELQLNQIKSNEMQATTKLSKVSPELPLQLHLYLHLTVCVSQCICRCICIFAGRSCSHEGAK